MLGGRGGGVMNPVESLECSVITQWGFSLSLQTCSRWENSLKILALAS